MKNTQFTVPLRLIRVTILGRQVHIEFQLRIHTNGVIPRVAKRILQEILPPEPQTHTLRCEFLEPKYLFIEMLIGVL